MGLSCFKSSTFLYLDTGFKIYCIISVQNHICVVQYDYIPCWSLVCYVVSCPDCVPGEINVLIKRPILDVGVTGKHIDAPITCIRELSQGDRCAIGLHRVVSSTEKAVVMQVDNTESIFKDNICPILYADISFCVYLDVSSAFNVEGGTLFQVQSGPSPILRTALSPTS